MYKSILYYKHSMPPTHFGHSCCYLQGGKNKNTDKFCVEIPPELKIT